MRIKAEIGKYYLLIDDNVQVLVKDYPIYNYASISYIGTTMVGAAWVDDDGYFDNARLLTPIEIEMLDL